MEPVFTDNRVLPHIRSALAEVLVIAALSPHRPPEGRTAGGGTDRCLPASCISSTEAGPGPVNDQLHSLPAQVSAQTSKTPPPGSRRDRSFEAKMISGIEGSE
ncbi:MAG: hypothetical protein OXC68_11760 [Aestuariivita sp.]|nr:hypothetical protein [Aestuariivita sp.]